MLADAAPRADGVLCLGDTVGYGADPLACIETVAARAQTVIGGNHEWAVAGRLDLGWFNRHARAAAEGGIEEERRLAYVGITRAMTTLVMSFAFERAKYGRLARSVPSRFLFESEGSQTPAGWQGVEAMAAPENDDEDAPAPKGKRGKKGPTRAAGARKAPSRASRPRRR